MNDHREEEEGKIEVEIEENEAILDDSLIGVTPA